MGCCSFYVTGSYSNYSSSTICRRSSFDWRRFVRPFFNVTTRSLCWTEPIVSLQLASLFASLKLKNDGVDLLGKRPRLTVLILSRRFGRSDCVHNSAVVDTSCFECSG